MEYEDLYRSKVIGGSIRIGSQRMAFGIAVPQHPLHTIGILQNWMQEIGYCPRCFCALGGEGECMNDTCGWRLPPAPLETHEIIWCEID